MAHNSLKRMSQVIDPRMECYRLERLIAALERQLDLLVEDNIRLEEKLDALSNQVSYQQQQIASLNCSGRRMK